MGNGQAERVLLISSKLLDGSLVFTAG
jgi:hypothetical protein